MGKKKFKFPEELLHRINECSFGGFLLFNFNEEGDFQTFGMFDNKIYAEALEKNLLSTVKAIEKFEIDRIIKNLQVDNDESGGEDQNAEN